MDSMQEIKDSTRTDVPEDDFDRGPGEGVVYGKLPGSGNGVSSHSVTDVMFGRLHR